jgi:hypothetical protein
MLQFRLRRGQFDRQLAQHLGVRMQGVTCLARQSYDTAGQRCSVRRSYLSRPAPDGNDTSRVRLSDLAKAA